MLKHRKRIPSTLKSDDYYKLAYLADAKAVTKAKYIETAVLKQIKKDERELDK